jgi:hypothetical protein
MGADLLAMRQARELFPLWTSRGLPDGTIHSAGISLLTALGQTLGYESYCEMPAPRQGHYAHVGDDVRSDSAWFNRSTGTAILLAEFERYSGIVDEGGLLAKIGIFFLPTTGGGRRSSVRYSRTGPKACAIFQIMTHWRTPTGVVSGLGQWSL